jgi:hypothetical protein
MYAAKSDIDRHLSAPVAKIAWSKYVRVVSAPAATLTRLFAFWFRIFVSGFATVGTTLSRLDQTPSAVDAIKNGVHHHFATSFVLYSPQIMSSVTAGKIETFIVSGCRDSGFIRVAVIIFGGYRRQTIWDWPASTKTVECAHTPQVFFIFETLSF